MRLLLAVVCMTLAMAGTSSAGDDLNALVDAGQLFVDSKVNDPGLLVPGQRTELVLEVATSNWFTGGTRIRIPEVPGLVILQTEQFAANASETRDGQPWVVQRWTLDMYPQREGDFSVPPIALSVSVNGGDRGDISGEILSPSVDFTVQIPSALEQADFWVASPSFSVTQSVDRETEALQPGDAFERRIVFEATEVQAMMLPTFAAERLPGLAAYPAPPELDTSNNRGQSRARRTQTISYVAEAPGTYLLPATDFFWWNTGSETLEVVSLQAMTIGVQGTQMPDHEKTAAPISRERLITGTVAALFTVLAVWLLLRYRPWRAVYRKLETPVDGLRRGLRTLRQPALPERLNPDSNAGE